MVSSVSAPGSRDRALARVRTRLTLWYAGTFSIILLLLGVGLFITVRRQLSRALDESLAAATLELKRVAGSRELASAGDSAVLDAVDELRIPQRTLYLFDHSGNPLSPTVADAWIRQSAMSALHSGSVTSNHETVDDRTLRLSARRFTDARGRVFVAAAIADQYELEDRYTELIGAFTIAALIAIVLVVIGGWILAKQSTAPIEANYANMRRFMADAAHQLKTPIAVLRANADVALQRPRDAEEYRQSLNAVEAESQRLGAIVDRLLILARADSGASVWEKRRLYLDDIVSDCVGASAPLAERRNVSIEVREFEATPVNGDPSLIRELIVILLDNAIKYSPAGGTVSVSVRMETQDAIVEVRDNGIGISAVDLPKIFRRFYRGERGRENEGAGLGLSIARWIADEHGATISVVSETDAGTDVTVRFQSA